MPKKSDVFNKLKSINIKQISLFVGIVLFIFVSFLAYQSAFLFNDKIHAKVVVGNISVGNLSKTEATEKIKTSFEKNEKIFEATAIYKDKKWTIQPTDINLSIDPKTLAEEAYKVGRDSNNLSLIKNIILLSGKDIIHIPFNPNYSQNDLYNILNTIASSLDGKAQNASLKTTKNKVEIIPEKPGITVDITKTFAEFTDKINKDLIFSFNIHAEEHKPKITESDLNGIDSLLASYTTYFNAYDHNRTKNIIIASEKITNILITPNQIFSFNQTVGLRLPEFGYLEAPVYINGKLEPDWGGGVCQVSTTLYNTVLLSGLKIVERSNHFSPVPYVPLGQDATVADNYLDLKFSNNLQNNIYLVSEVSGGQITISIYGKKIPNSPEYYITHRVERTLENKTVTKDDPTLLEGTEEIEEEGHGGLVVSSFRVKKENGAVVSSEHLYTDVFPALDKVIKKGTKKDPLAKKTEDKNKKDNKKDSKKETTSATDTNTDDSTDKNISDNEQTKTKDKKDKDKKKNKKQKEPED
ncbi:VanW family protein [Selenomonadales bacterium OttesenSCG-928-I06]|nr:VanW family protein [Selenomonadales bacterium OttesenSCG-928-I06]